ncbi:hypothetical protein RR42_s0082 [Cupriavidus basilensis]|uniref:Uncharacterized protein n=1 Tax=Cupriavidus basilensis TaxID=68895 RepID=A0A0C4YG60_9BURK|nr:hypothetical protein RR42_s0082 [Cupriavidus basilensis]
MLPDVRFGRLRAAGIVVRHAGSAHEQHNCAKSKRPHANRLQ